MVLWNKQKFYSALSTDAMVRKSPLKYASCAEKVKEDISRGNHNDGWFDKCPSPFSPLPVSPDGKCDEDNLSTVKAFEVVSHVPG